ncbi:MAG: amidohydrolase family protein [Armatimonadetes bacterium]|nr:amidohydrolase family protein [Armatimonadota bacterium]
MQAEPFDSPPAIMDALCYLGKGKHPVNPDFYGHTAESLLEEMEHNGISEAVVCHNMVRQAHPVDGNAALMAAIAGRPRLRACWALFSRASREYEDFEGYIEEAFRQGVRCFAVFPRFGAYPPGLDLCLREYVQAGTFAPLESRGLPLFLDFGADPAGGADDTDWEALRYLLTAHPRLPVILCEYRLRGGNRIFPGVMDDCPNLHLETSGMWNWKSLEFVARHWGAGRLVYGSRTPWRSAGLALGMVTMADLPATDRAMILGGNLRRMMEEA